MFKNWHWVIIVLLIVGIFIVISNRNQQEGYYDYNGRWMSPYSYYRRYLYDPYNYYYGNNYNDSLFNNNYYNNNLAFYDANRIANGYSSYPSYRYSSYRY